MFVLGGNVLLQLFAVLPLPQCLSGSAENTAIMCFLFSFCFLLEKHKIVRNTRTQTSPQESVSSEESLLQTPLPRKRPPVPAVPDSYYDLPRSRSKGTRFDVDRRGEKKARVRFEPDVPPTLPSYMKEMTDKGNYC